MKTSYCEVYIRHILPNVRVYIAEKLVKQYGFSQLEVAKLLGVTQPLINYYVTGRRKPKNTDKLVEIPVIRKVVDEAVSCLISNRKECLKNLTCVLCNVIRSSEELPKIFEVIGQDITNVSLPTCGVVN